MHPDSVMDLYNNNIHNDIHHGAGPCRMTLELVSEEVASGDLSTLFPFNALRNHALLLVRTEVSPMCCTCAFQAVFAVRVPELVMLQDCMDLSVLAYMLTCACCTSAGTLLAFCAGLQTQNFSISICLQQLQLLCMRC